MEVTGGQQPSKPPLAPTAVEPISAGVATYRDDGRRRAREPPQAPHAAISCTGASGDRGERPPAERPELIDESATADGDATYHAELVPRRDPPAGRFWRLARPNEALAAGSANELGAKADPQSPKYRAGYRIRTGDLQLGKARRHPTSTQLASCSSHLSVPWRPKALRVVALKVGFEVGSF
jgi:hypothetical protein